MNTSRLDSIIFDERLQKNTLIDVLYDLDQMPESWINTLYEKSYDDMDSIEVQNCIEEIKKYLENNMPTEDDFFENLFEEINWDADLHPEISFDSGTGFFFNGTPDPDQLKAFIKDNMLDEGIEQTEIEAWMDKQVF